jgi:DNA-binding beta-propeller fold protein YncE
MLAGFGITNIHNAPSPCVDASSGATAFVVPGSDPAAVILVRSTWVIDGTPHKFSRPTALAGDEQGNLYVVDGGNQQIKKFDCNGQLVRKWGRRGSGKGQFVFLDDRGHFGAVAADQNGHIYVADHNFRIQKFTTDGKFLMQWGSEGTGDGQFGEFIDLAVDSAGNVFVTDPVNQRIQKFDSDGKFLAKWNTPKCSFFTPRPVGIAVNAQGEVFVTDAHSHCIEKFDNNGNFISTLGKFSETNLPTGIAVDTQGNIFVTDNQAGVIWKFDSKGNLLVTWNSSDPDYGWFDSPQGQRLIHREMCTSSKYMVSA